MNNTDKLESGQRQAILKVKQEEIRKKNEKRNETRGIKRVVICQELVSLTGDLFSAVILSQMVFYECHRGNRNKEDFYKYLMEERFKDIGYKITYKYGWVYKKAKELANETYLLCDEKTIRDRLIKLVSKGWLRERRNPYDKRDRILQYRVSLTQVRQDIELLGFTPDKYSKLDHELYYEYLTNVHYAHEAVEFVRELEEEVILSLST